MTRALMQQFPRLAGQVPWLPLADLPTPVEPLATVSPKLWIKRDDLTSTLYGGNKVRKLELILAQVLRSGKRQVVTFGATGTNHGVATAAFCQLQGIACTVLMFDQPANEKVAKNQQLMRFFGAQLIYVGSLWRTVLHFYVWQRLRYPRAYFVFAGGSNIEGCIGFVNAAYELKQQIEAGELPQPEVIYCALGSGSTLAGLTLGCALAGLDCKVQGVRVAASHLGIIPTCTASTVATLMRKTYHLLRKLDPSIPVLALPPVLVEQNYYGRGYGVPTAQGEAAAGRFADAGIALEQTYTCKTAAAVLDYCAQHPQSTVLYWHTYNSVDMRSALEG
jgi:D-cysteine desulfhydrase